MNTPEQPSFEPQPSPATDALGRSALQLNPATLFGHETPLTPMERGARQVAEMTSPRGTATPVGETDRMRLTHLQDQLAAAEGQLGLEPVDQYRPPGHPDRPDRPQ